MGAEIFEIDRGRCTECVGHHDEPRCIDVCPADSIICDPVTSEDRNALLEKYQRLTTGNPEHGQSLARKSA